MNTRGLLVTIFAVALSVAPQLVSTSSAAGTYSATLISPRAWQVLYPGQKIMVEWNSTLPNIDLTGCEREVWLSLDGGRTFTTCITPILPPKADSYLWTVPNLPTNAAVMDIRFGCEDGIPKATPHKPCQPLSLRSRYRYRNTARISVPRSQGDTPNRGVALWRTPPAAQADART